MFKSRENKTQSGSDLKPNPMQGSRSELGKLNLSMYSSNTGIIIRYAVLSVLCSSTVPACVSYWELSS